MPIHKIPPMYKVGEYMSVYVCAFKYSAHLYLRRGSKSSPRKFSKLYASTIMEFLY